MYFCNMTDLQTKEYIQNNRKTDVRKLALGKRPEGVDMQYALTQISGWQAACQKVPLWAENPDIEYPVHLSLEQCTSQYIAEYKANMVSNMLPDGFSMIDLTGGMGVDCYFISKNAGKVIYNDMNPDLCEIARNNFAVLGRDNVLISNKSAEKLLQETLQSSNQYLGFSKPIDLIYLDPARRGDTGKKLVSISDCQPDVVAMQDSLLSAAQYIMVKFSPMLDISKALSELRNVCQITVISLAGECKELVVLMSRESTPQVTIEAVNIDKNGVAGSILRGTKESDALLPLAIAEPEEIHPGMILYEPFAAHMKSGLYRTLSVQTGTKQVHVQTHLFISSEPIPDFPGRSFVIKNVIPFSGKSASELTKCKANVACRNFPMTPEELKKRFKITDGGDRYLFATTISPSTKAILDTEKLPR